MKISVKNMLVLYYIQLNTRSTDYRLLQWSITENTDGTNIKADTRH